MKRVGTKIFVKAQAVLEGLQQVDQSRLPDDLTAKELEKLFNKAKKIDNERIDALARYRKLVDQAAALRNDLNEKVVRIRLAVKAIFGPDSHEYQLVGGTRASERKRRSRGQ